MLVLNANVFHNIIDELLAHCAGIHRPQGSRVARKLYQYAIELEFGEMILD